jgi:hypothetical protein
LPKHAGENLTITTSSGSGSANTVINDGDLVAVEIIAVASATTQDISLTDVGGLVVWKQAAVGNQFFHVNLPLLGVYTVALSNASSNGANTVKLMTDPY